MLLVDLPVWFAGADRVVRPYGQQRFALGRIPAPVSALARNDEERDVGDAVPYA